jgi:hypothetical protein
MMRCIGSTQILSREPVALAIFSKVRGWAWNDRLFFFAVTYNARDMPFLFPIVGLQCA